MQFDRHLVGYRLVIILLFISQSAVFSQEPVTDPDNDSGTIADAVVLSESNGSLDITFGSSYVYDSNLFLLPAGNPSSLGIFELEASYLSDNQSVKGGYYGIRYNGEAYLYENASARSGREPFEHYINAFVGLNGGRTHLRLNGNYHDNNGNSLGTGYAGFDQLNANQLDTNQFDREVRLATSQDYDFSIELSRDLPHGSIETGFTYVRRDFSGSSPFTLNSGTRYIFDAALYNRPRFASKTDFGLGFTAGHDDYDNNTDQDYYTPSTRVRYKYSGKTAFYGDYGYEFRNGSGIEGVSSGASVYSYGLNWSPTVKTTLDLRGYRNVQPSYVASDQDYTADGIRLSINQLLPKNFTLSSSAGYEYAKYFSSTSGTSTNRKDKFLQLEVEISHQIRFTEKLDGKISIFYNYNDNDSTLLLSTYNRHVTGIRFSLSY